MRVLGGSGSSNVSPTAIFEVLDGVFPFDCLVCK